MRSFIALKSDQRGNVLMLTGLAILILFAVAGAGVDFGRQQLVRMKLQNASDAAAIAAASLPESTSSEQRRAVALRYYNLNFPSSYLGVARPTPNIQVGGQIVVDASTSMNANFVSNVGVERLEAQGRTVVDRVAAQNSIYDVILVMDNSGSMANATTAPTFTASDERDNARNAGIQRCHPEMQVLMAQGPNRWCGNSKLPDNGLTMPMGDGTSRTYRSVAECQRDAWGNFCALVGYGTTTSNGTFFYPYGFAVDATATRLAALRTVALNFVSRILEEGASGSRVGTVTWSSSVIGSQPLTSSSSIVEERIHDMSAWGATNPYVAMQNAASLSASFANDHIKAVVLMTDGKPTLVGPIIPATGMDTSGCNGNRFCASAVNNTLAICTQLKNSGVQVYTVGFLNPRDTEFSGANSGDYSRAVAFLSSCASVDGEGNPRTFTAQNGAQLEQAFTQILTSLGRIRISQ